MKHIFLFYFAFLIINYELKAQELLWANKVIEKSTEEHDDEHSPKYRAIQILGKPNVLPQTISSPCSWHPLGTNYGEDYIKVGFEKAIKARQIIIGETVNAGAIARIFGYSENGEEYLLYENTSNNSKYLAGVRIELIQVTPKPINAIKILIVHSLSKGPKEYDAIGISDSETPFVAKINVAENIPNDLVKENLGSNINSKYGELAPVVTPNGRFLYFTRINHPGNIGAKESKNEKNARIAQDIWYSKLSSSGTWGEAMNVGEPINNKYNNAICGISPDGKTMYLLNLYNTNMNEMPKAGISKSIRIGEKWQFPTEMKIDGLDVFPIIENGVRKTDLEFSISLDEKIIIIATKLQSTFGDKDLYVSFRISPDHYTKPVSMGGVLNSAGNEGSPFLASDNKTLYFNSNGHPGYGESDIYLTTRLDETWKKWSPPINIGNKINSSEFDGFITIPASGEFAYFSSYKNSLGSDDIFKVKLFPSIKPNILALYDIQFKDKLTGAILHPNLKIEISESKNNKETEKPDVSFDEESKKFNTILNAGNLYNLSATLTDYKNLNEKIDLTKLEKYAETSVVFWLESSSVKMPQKGERLILNSLYFDQSQAVIKEESYEELNKIKKWMTENPLMEILLEGHSDNIGDIGKNIKLAEDRVIAVKDYLTKDGIIDKSRINIKSWGPYKPLYQNPTELERKKNRRVEFTILKM